MTQFTRIYLDKDGNIDSVHTQTSPLPDGFEPVMSEAIVTHWDCQLPDHPDGFMRAREVINGMEHKGKANDNKPPTFRGNAPRKVAILKAKKKE